MKTKLHPTPSLLAVSCLAVTTMTGCQQEGFNQFNGYLDIGNIIGGLIDVIGIDDTDREVPVEEIVDVCSGDHPQYVIVEQTRKLLFKEEEEACDWGQNGNLDKKEQYFAARREQIHLIDLAEGSVLCDMSFTSLPNQAMYYDDHFLITLNNVVFAATNDELIPMLDTKGSNNLPFYEWDHIVNQKWIYLNGSETPYCLGKNSVCDWPGTQQNGRMTVEIDETKVQEIMALDIDRNFHQLAFITTGDNDPNDCKHSDFAFDVQLKFASPVNK